MERLMYKLLLCLRYLRTRYIALASIVSVTLGVATMIVVNSVMEGFTREMQARIHGILADLVFESHNLEGFPDADAHMRQIREVAGQYIAGMTPTVAVPAQIAFDVNGRRYTRHVSFIGVDPATYGQVSDFNRYLQHPQNQRGLSFELHESGYADGAGWPHRREMLNRKRDAQPDAQPAESIPVVEAPQPPELIAHQGWKFRRVRPAVDPANQPDKNARIANPFAQLDAEQAFDPASQAHTGIVMGIGIARVDDGEGQRQLIVPGDDVKVSVPTAGMPPKVASDTFTIVDFYESEMHEYDANFIFVPLAEIQKMRGMFDPQSGVGYVTAIQIKLHDEADGERVRALLREAFPATHYGIATWRDKQGPLLAAVAMQTGILNVLLFLIIAVAGFGILATFCLIVVEKKRDIGILKSLGASSEGILQIFLGYGLSLGIVGSVAGLVIGLAIVANINRIADGLARLAGHDLFDPTIYYFQEIPTIVEPLTVVFILLGAITIAVSASIVPAILAALLHPVEALRHE
jgi:lipoprotein-releasing system permease protein